jgi:hypothetical protein
VALMGAARRIPIPHQGGVLAMTRIAVERTQGIGPTRCVRPVRDTALHALLGDESPVAAAGPHPRRASAGQGDRERALFPRPTSVVHDSAAFVVDGGITAAYTTPE